MVFPLEISSPQRIFVKQNIKIIFSVFFTSKVELRMRILFYDASSSFLIRVPVNIFVIEMTETIQPSCLLLTIIFVLKDAFSYSHYCPLCLSIAGISLDSIKVHPGSLC